MKIAVFSLLLVCSVHSFAKGHDIIDQNTSLEVNKIFSDSYKPGLASLVDYIDKDNKVTSCIDNYVKKQLKSYSRIAQENLYGLIHNFDGVLSKLYGKKELPDDIPYSEKIELLARVQCEAYYKIGALK